MSVHYFSEDKDISLLKNVLRTTLSNRNGRKWSIGWRVYPKTSHFKIIIFTLLKHGQSNSFAVDFTFVKIYLWIAG